MGGITTAMGIGYGMSGARTRGEFLLGEPRREPYSFGDSLGLGVVVGLIVFVLYTFNTWPYFQDIWGRPPRAHRDLPRSAAC